MMRNNKSLLLFISLLLLIQSTQAYPITVTDSLGNEITIEKAPERIISLIPSNTEILFAVGAGDKVVGVTDHCDFPAEARNISAVGGYAGFNTEKILELEPDLVLGEAGNDKDTLDNLRKHGLTVVTLESKTVEDILDNILLVGSITGNENKSMEIVDGMREAVGLIKEQAGSMTDSERPRVLYLVSLEPMYVAGANSFPDSLITIAGGKNIVEAENWPILSLEEVVDKDPDIIICSGMGGFGDIIKGQVVANKLMSETNAMKNDKVIVISDSNLIERPGPRIVDGLAELHGYFSDFSTGASMQSQNEGQSAGSLAQPDKDAAGSPSAAAPGFGFLIAVAMLVGACFLKNVRK
jgi:iron complex transport system substrate-binding protein